MDRLGSLIGQTFHECLHPLLICVCFSHFIICTSVSIGIIDIILFIWIINIPTIHIVHIIHIVHTV